MKKSDHMGVGEKRGDDRDWSSSYLNLDVTRAVQHGATILAPVLAVAFVAVAFVGTTSASWFGSHALLEEIGTHSAPTASYLCTSITMVAVGSETLKMALAAHLGRGRLPRQTAVLVLWALCVTYGWLMPVLLLVHMPIWPTGDAVFALCAIAWAFVQLTSGLALAVQWSTSNELVIADRRSASTEKPMPDQRSDPVAGAETGPTPIDDDSFFHVLRKLDGQPGSTIGRGVRIGRNREIIGSQRDLANLLGLSKPTAHRLIHRLAKEGRISLQTDGSITRIIWP